MNSQTYTKQEGNTLKTLVVYKDHATLDIIKDGELQNVIIYNEESARVYGYHSLDECIQEKIKSME